METTITTITDTSQLDKMLLDNPDTNKLVRKIMSQVIRAARARISKNAKASVGTGYENSFGDLRKSYLAVKHSIYKKILGGNVSILNKRKASNKRVVVTKKRILDANPHQRGGNRRPRSKRTEDIDGYYGSDRGFILRFINSGVSPRSTRYGNRGSISGRSFFPELADRELKQAAEEFNRIIEEELAKIGKA